MKRILPHLTATTFQAATYLLGVSLFSISFLVFLTSTLSFVITESIGQRHHIGTDVGNLGFADELVALVACPLWGLISDRIGVRWVAVIGYLIIGGSLACLVQSSRVYPDLLIWRMVFSLGAAAATTMVTATLPALTAPKGAKGNDEQDGTNGTGSEAQPQAQSDGTNRHSLVSSVSSELTVTPARYESTRGNKSPLLARYRRQRRAVQGDKDDAVDVGDPEMDTSRIAGFVGMFTGIGALIALGLFLPLPVTLGEGVSKAQAVKNSYYIVGSVAIVVAIFVAIGLRNLPGEEDKGFKQIFAYSPQAHSASDRSRRRLQGQRKHDEDDNRKPPSLFNLFGSAVFLGLTDSRVAIGYIGGFVARASSIGVSTFIPLFVNAYFVRTGRCSSDPDELIKDNCKEAYKMASILTGISQLVALLAAPLYGFFQARYGKRPFASRAPIALAATAGLIGNVVFGRLTTPDVKQPGGHGAIIAVVLIGISQIGAIVCSLGILSQGIQNMSSSDHVAASDSLASNGHVGSTSNGAANGAGPSSEEAPLLPDSASAGNYAWVESRTHLKGSIAGVYSLAGGAAILLLTKLGGYLFDVSDVGAPFYLLAAFNAILLTAVIAIAGGKALRDQASGSGLDIDEAREGAG